MSKRLKPRLSRPLVAMMPTAPMAANTRAMVMTMDGMGRSRPIMSLNISLPTRAMIRPPTSIYQKPLSYRASRYFPRRQYWYICIPRPANRWIMPSRKLKSISLMGSSKGANHRGGTFTSFPKKVLVITGIASPK